MYAIDTLNEIADKIRNQDIPSSKICKAHHILDWLMQKSWSKTLTYTSYPDEKVHSVHDGLMEVFVMIDEMSCVHDKMISQYNQELYKVLQQVEKLQENYDAITKDKLERIQAILNESY